MASTQGSALADGAEVYNTGYRRLEGEQLANEVERFLIESIICNVITPVPSLSHSCCEDNELRYILKASKAERQWYYRSVPPKLWIVKSEAVRV